MRLPTMIGKKKHTTKCCWFCIRFNALQPFIFCHYLKNIIIMMIIIIVIIIAVVVIIVIIKLMIFLLNLMQFLVFNFNLFIIKWENDGISIQFLSLNLVAIY